MISHIQEIANKVSNFPPYNTSIAATAKRFIAYGKMFPVLHVIQEDGSLVPQVPEAFVRDFMLDPGAVGWREELRGSPPMLVIKILRASDIYKGSIQKNDFGIM